MATTTKQQPTAEAHLEAASKHATAQRHHKEAAKKLKQGKHVEAKKHAKTAAGHSKDATAASDAVLILYEVWEI
jgi:hypothetical protein